MSKKKTRKADQQESPEQVEGQEISNSEEHVPPTIVESGMEEVFLSEGEEQSDPKDAGTKPTTEKPVPKPRVSKRPYIADVEAMLSAGTHTKQELLAFIMEKYPEGSKGGASTFLTDLMNEKYRHWKDRPVVRTPDGKLVFADRIEASGPEVVPEADPTEKPAE